MVIHCERQNLVALLLVFEMLKKNESEHLFYWGCATVLPL